MKVTKDTSDLLIVEDRPWLFGLMLVVTMLLLIGSAFFTYHEGNTLVTLLLLGLAAGMFALFRVIVQRTAVYLDRKQATFAIRTRTLRGTKTTLHPLVHLDHAIVQTSASDDTDAHRLALVVSGGMDAGTHPVTRVYTSGNGADHAAQAINAWLARTRLDSAPTRD